jgi:hypothetical protein
MVRSNGPMSRQRVPAAIAAAAAAILLVAYVVTWAGVSRADIGASDFTATYVGATLLRDGHGAAMYDDGLQTSLHSRLIAPAVGGNLAYVYPPAAALVVMPLSLLPLTGAYRVAQALEVLMLVAGVVVAARAAPWPLSARRRWAPAAAAAVAVAGTSTLALGLVVQWDGLSALGLGVAYALWRREARFAGGAVLATTMTIAKPHLALGLAALLLGWRDRRILAGAAAGVVAVASVSLMAVGPAGLAGFVGAVVADGHRWPMASMLGFASITGTWLGDGGTAQLVAAGASVTALAGCVVLGRRVARDRASLEVCLAAATILSLAASPHLLGHDLVQLAPVLVGVLARAATRDGGDAWPASRSWLVLVGWTLLSLAATLDMGAQDLGPPGRLVPWLLITVAIGLACSLRAPARRLAAAPT